MGIGLHFKCKSCGYKTDEKVGGGRSYPEVYNRLVGKILLGDFGQGWKELFRKTPGAAINAGGELYICSCCGFFRTELDLSLYKPVIPNPCDANSLSMRRRRYVPVYDLHEDKYRLVKAYPHTCSNCGELMHQFFYNETLKCPNCRKDTLEYDPNVKICWD